MAMNETARLTDALKAMGLSPQALQGFLRLVEKYHRGPARVDDWDRVAPPGPEDLPLLSSLHEPDAATARTELARLAVCKLNGGLGTTMGCRQPKSTLPVRGQETFLDLIVEQLSALPRESGQAVPLVLMNSFYTDALTAKVIHRYDGRLPIRTFMQNRFPRLREADLMPIHEAEFGAEAWYPPGHGDIYACLAEQGILDELLAAGREVMFLSNADNLGATVDPRILHHMLDGGIPFIMEVTPKTAADVKGGTLYRREGKLKLLELAHVPELHVGEFCGQEKFRVFNTNNLWIHLGRLKQALTEGPLDLDLIVNRKEIAGTRVVQLETAAGSAMDQFPGALGLVVERDRFLPVKKTEDLLCIRSDLFHLDGGHLRRSPGRTQPGLPLVRLDERFSTMDEFDRRVPAPLGLLALDSLEVRGDVSFAGTATLKGEVRLVAKNGPLIIPAGTLLEDRDLIG
jgi:UTP--glucose-1-phosphate uridylyltransferase